MGSFVLVNHTASTPGTGMTSRHHYLARELVRLGHKVTVVGARTHHLLKENIKADALPSEETVDGYRFLRIDVPEYHHAHDKRRVIAWFAFSAKLARLKDRFEERTDAVLYSSPDPVGYLGAERLAASLGARLIFEVRDLWPLTLIEIGGYKPSHPFIRFLNWIEKRAYQRSRKVLSNLEGAVKHMLVKGLQPEKFVWISNGFDLDEIAVPQALTKQTFEQLPKEGFNIVYTGTLGAANALFTVLDAAAFLGDRANVTILLVGQGRERAELQARSVQLGLKNVRFLDPVPKAQMPSLLAACDACIISTLDSPLYRYGISPNKLFDYFASGRPVISLYSGKYDMVARYNAGIQVPAEDPVACANAIKRMRDMSSTQRAVLGENGRRAVYRELNYAKLAVKLEQVLVGAD